MRAKRKSPGWLGSALALVLVAMATMAMAADEPSQESGLAARAGSSEAVEPDAVDNDGDGVFVPQDCNDNDPLIYPGAPERCNGLDDDCNGSADETYTDLGDACTAGIGECEAGGFTVCNATQDGTVCNAVPDAPGLEVCGNGLDDNCNGTTDEIDRWVDDAGSDVDNDCTDPLAPCATIQRGVDQVCETGTVTVGDGAYAGQVVVAKPLTLVGAQAGVPVASRTAGAASESIVTGSAAGGVFQITSGGVTIDGFDIVGGGSAYSGIHFFNGGNGTFADFTFANNFIHGCRADNPNSVYNVCYGVFAGSGQPGDRGTITDLTITGNDIFDNGIPGSIAARGLFLYTVQGGSVGSGATVTGNSFRDLYSESASNSGVGVAVDIGTDDGSGTPLTPCSGILVSGNTYSNLAAGAGMFAASSSFAEANASFTGVSAYFLNSGRLTTVDEAILEPFARTDRPTGYASSDAYFATIQSAIANSDPPDVPNVGDPRATVFVSNGTFVESNITVDRPILVDGAARDTVLVVPAGEDDNIDSTFGGTSLQHGFVVAASNVTIQDLTIDGEGNPSLTPGKNNYRMGVVTDFRNGVVYDALRLDNLRIFDTYRRAVQVYSSNAPGSPRSTGNVVTNTVVDDVALYSAITFFESDGEMTGNTVTNASTAIGSNWINTADNSPRVQIRGNSVSSVEVGMNLSGLNTDSVIGGPNPADANVVDVSGDGTAGVGIVVQYAMQMATPVGAPVRVEGNQVTGDGGDAGIWLFHNEKPAFPIDVVGNTLTSTSSTRALAGEGAGIFLTDDGDFFGDEDGDSYATLAGNTVTGFVRGIDLHRSGSAPAGGRNVKATIGGSGPGVDNTISAAAGGVGIVVYEVDGSSNGGRKAVATIANNRASIAGGAIGIDVDGGDATITGNTIDADDTGIRVRNDGLAAATGNSIFSHTSYGFDNQTASTMTATCNWWGSAGGPNSGGDATNGPLDLLTWLEANDYNEDQDGDTFTSCTNSGDCNIADGSISPAGIEVCDGIDQDCDDVIDDGVTTDFYADADTDTFGDAGNVQAACAAPVGYVANADDCDDTDAEIYPGAGDLCANGIDEDCDGVDDTTNAPRYVATGGTNFANDCSDPLSPCATITHGILAACPADTVNVDPGSYVEDVRVNKQDLVLQGAGIDQTIIVGPNVPGAQPNTLAFNAPGAVVDGVTVTREGNNPIDWAANVKTSGVAFFTGSGNNTLRNSKVVNNRNGIYINASSGHVIEKSVIVQNRTGANIFGGVTNVRFEENTIADNSTFGVIFINMANPSSNTVFFNNDISGNWYGQIEDQSTAGADLRDLSGNWLGTIVPVLDSANTVHPGYAAQIPDWAGGPDTAPATLPEGRIAGVSLAKVDFTPWLNTGIDTDGTANGFQGDFSYLHVDDDSAQITATGRIQEAVDLVTGSTVDVKAGLYVEQVRVAKALELFGAGSALTTIKAPAVLTADPLTSQFSIVTVDGGGSPLAVEVRDLEIAGPGPTGCGSLHFGLLAYGSAALDLHDAKLTDIRDEPFSGCQNGRAVKVGVNLSPTPSPATATITNNVFSGYQKNGVVIEGAGSSATITGNTVSGFGPQTTIAQNGVVVLYGAAATVTGNTITGHACDNALCGPDLFTQTQSAGVLLIQTASPTIVENNPVIDGNDMGIYFWSPGETATITGNALTNNRYEGMLLNEGTVAVTGNTITGGNTGVAVVSFDGDSMNVLATLTENTITGALQEGILVADDETGDAFVPVLDANRNHIAGNAVGIENTTTNVDDTDCNWWGANGGPNSAGADTYVGPSTPSFWLLAADFGIDNDGDSFTSCTSDAGGDCNIADATTYPTAPENCNGIDNNCNGIADDLDAEATAFCDDGLFCTGTETCDGLVCLASGDPCVDGNLCSLDVCDDGTDTCDNSQASGDCAIAGLVTYYREASGVEPSTKPVSLVDVDVTGSVSNGPTDTTDDFGAYDFADPVGNITLEPQDLLATDFECDAAISASDATEVAKHAVGLITLTPNQFVAGDVSDNGNVTAFDASLIAQKSVAVPCTSFVFNARTNSGSDWEFVPASKSFSPIAGGENYDFLAVLYGDVTGNWSSHDAPPPSGDGLVASAPEADLFAGQTLGAPVAPSSGAFFFIAEQPVRNEDGSYTVVLGLQHADGIQALDLALVYDAQRVTLRQLAPVGIAASMHLAERDDRAAGRAQAALFGVQPMLGTGAFLSVTFETAEPVSGLPLSIEASANEGAIPLSWAGTRDRQGVVRGVATGTNLR